MNKPHPEETGTVDLERMNLFVIPVSFRLLSTPNRAMDSDFVFAKEKHIPVLPVMLEQGLDDIFSRPDRFGELQYLAPYSQDATAISYEDKLKRFLESTLISSEMAQRVRDAFDAYIFLSYRKKDRRYANELMRLIHANPVCRDIAIWYDEFLTPGENFNDAIGLALEKSDLFTLLVTPNLINEENYVQTTEYPMAQNAGKDILPTEMVTTDSAELRRQYKGIPDSVNARDEAAFKARLLESVSRLALRENDGDPAHNFLIGLAYLDGIDVEVDRTRAVELITSAAEAELPEAMEKLNNMYYEGAGVERDWRMALKWREKIADYYRREKGGEHPDTLLALNDLALLLETMGEYRQALELQEKVYTLRCRISGEEHPETLTALSNLAVTLGEVGEYRRALELLEKAYTLQCRISGEEHPKSLTALNNLALSLREVGEYRQALALQEKAYTLRCRISGEEHPETLIVLSNLAVILRNLGEYRQALALQEKAYTLQCRILGEEHPDTLLSLNNLALIWRKLGVHRKALELQEKAYGLLCKVFGEEHRYALTALNNLAVTWEGLGDHHKALELLEKVHSLLCKVFGEEHPATLSALNNLAHVWGKLGDQHKKLELLQKVYELRCKALGEEHPDSLAALTDMVEVCSKLRDHARAAELAERAYELRCRVLGEKHPATMLTLNILVQCCAKAGKFIKMFKYAMKQAKLST